MLIPIRCFTCGKVLGNLWKKYKEEADKIDQEYQKQFLLQYEDDIDKHLTDNKEYKNIHPAYKKKVLDDLEVKRMCCRRHLISNVDMIKKI